MTDSLLGRYALKPLFFVSLLFLFSAFAAAQTPTANLAGTVTDDLGNPLAGSTILARNPETGFERLDLTDEKGAYRIPSLPFGVYNVSAEIQGFASKFLTGIRLDVGRTISLDFILKLTSSPQTVEVSGRPPLIDRTESQIDRVTGRRVFVNVLFGVFSPVQRLLANSFAGVVNTFENYVTVVGATKENQQLRKEVSELRIRLQATSQQQQENERLRQILGLKEALPFRLEAAEVIGRDAKSMISNSLTINRGAASGVRLQIPVLTPGGVLGMTTLVSSITSKVQLITDPSSSVGAMLERGRVSGILAGAGGGICILRFLPLTTDLKKDDVVITSGQDAIFPEGLPLGKITRELRESEFYRSAEVTPFKTHSSLSEVVLLIQPGTSQDK